MRALGILSDKKIIEHCLLDIDKYASYIDLFIPCVHDAGMIFSREQALKYIATFTKHKTIPHALEILANYFLPHIGDMNFIAKAYYLGHMVRELLRVFTNDTSPTTKQEYFSCIMPPFAAEQVVSASRGRLKNEDNTPGTGVNVTMSWPNSTSSTLPFFLTQIQRMRYCLGTVKHTCVAFSV